MYEPGTKEAYEEHLGEARISKWFRNITGLGIVGITAYMNTAEMTRAEHVELTAGGMAFAGVAAWTLERCRRQAVHDSHIEAAFAHIHANQSGHPVPSWAEGNAGNILEPRPRPPLQTL